MRTFKKRRSFRRRFRAPLARKRRTWVTGIRSGCLVSQVPYDPSPESCSTQFKIVLLDNATLEAGFSDRLTVRRILGHVWTLPTASFGNDQIQNYGDLSTAFWMQHVGLLRKPLGRDFSGALVTPNYFPITADFDFSEAEWLHTWHQAWFPGDNSTVYEFQTTADGSQAVVADQCLDVHTTGAPDNIFTDGTGTIDIETDCNPPNCFQCDVAPGIQFADIQVSVPKVKPIAIDFKRKIPMREDQELFLHFDFANVSGTPPELDWVMQWYAWVKILVEF